MADRTSTPGPIVKPLTSRATMENLSKFFKILTMTMQALYRRV